jgi:type II secretion system protein C
MFSAAALLLAAALATPPPDLTVVGVVVGGAEAHSSAILCSEGHTRVVTVGESAFGGRLLSVAENAVVLDFAGEHVELRLPEASRIARTPPPPPQPVGLPPGAPPLDPATPPREMDRLSVQRRLGEEIPRILAETGIAPLAQDGRVLGMQITRLPEGTLLSDAGLRAGDVITRINGTEIDGMATLVSLWPRLQNATELRAVVLRNGQPQSLLVTLR